MSYLYFWDFKDSVVVLLIRYILHGQRRILFPAGAAYMLETSFIKSDVVLSMNTQLCQGILQPCISNQHISHQYCKTLAPEKNHW